MKRPWRKQYHYRGHAETLDALSTIALSTCDLDGEVRDYAARLGDFARGGVTEKVVDDLYYATREDSLVAALGGCVSCTGLMPANEDGTTVFENRVAEAVVVIAERCGSDGESIAKAVTAQKEAAILADLASWKRPWSKRQKHAGCAEGIEAFAELSLTRGCYPPSHHDYLHCVSLWAKGGLTSREMFNSYSEITRPTQGVLWFEMAIDDVGSYPTHWIERRRQYLEDLRSRRPSVDWETLFREAWSAAQGRSIKAKGVRS